MSREPTGTDTPSCCSIRAASRCAIGTPRLRMPTRTRSAAPPLRSTISCALGVGIQLLRCLRDSGPLRVPDRERIAVRAPADGRGAEGVLVDRDVGEQRPALLEHEAPLA